ncbi:helix-turn-helix domain-containing protein [Clostridium sp. 1001275B_160808_H3]|uniref:helix-turn-helix domain-containing protein n=1 Tax=Clostridium sp. 1001275B_160808_H3 TaxID=2787110 RepID=UPI00189BD4F4|nr:helix-turn-helix domain-containing protein [Clostridium sp. 1001275B_160808_H3]
MSKEKLLPISIFSLAISLIISASIISSSIQQNGEFIGSGISQGLNNINNTINQENNNNLDSKDILSLDEASKYLGISQERLNQVIIKDDSIPYVQISGEFIFSKNALEEWVKTSKFKM